MTAEFQKSVKVKFEKGIFRPLEKIINLEEGEYIISIQPAKKATGLASLLAGLEDKIAFDVDEVDDFLETRRWLNEYSNWYFSIYRLFVKDAERKSNATIILEYASQLTVVAPRIFLIEWECVMARITSSFKYYMDEKAKQLMFILEENLFSLAH